jgi:hypothetical protein
LRCLPAFGIGFSHDNPASELQLPRLGYRLPDVLKTSEVERVLQQPDVTEPVGGVSVTRKIVNWRNQLLSLTILPDPIACVKAIFRR